MIAWSWPVVPLRPGWCPEPYMMVWSSQAMTLEGRACARNHT
jgi:hypothetical protein